MKADEKEHMSYRIHENNVMAKKPIKRRLLLRIKTLFEVERDYYNSSIAAELLNHYREYIPDQNADMLRILSQYRNTMYNRLELLLDHRIKSGYFKFDFNFKYRVFIGKA